MANDWASGGWIKRLLAEDFSASCKEDRFCVPCAAAFCHHCCGAHHRGQGHEVVVRAEAEPGAAQGHSGSSSRGRDSFCVSCRAGFSATLCAHHSGHDTFRIDVREGRYCARCTGSEPWFHVFDGIDTYYDEEKGHILVPLHLVLVVVGAAEKELVGPGHRPGEHENLKSAPCWPTMATGILH